jgi:hypothetical protein
MLKITQNIFEAIHEKLDASDEEGIDHNTNTSLCGIIVPDLQDVPFSEESASAPIFESQVQKSFKDIKWMLFAIDSAWQMDTPRMRLLGSKPTIGELIKSGGQIFATRVLSSTEGKIRHAVLFGFEQYQAKQATQFITKHPRHSFLIADLAMKSKPSDLLELICNEGIHDVLNSKKRPFIRWKRLTSLSGDRRIAFGTILGWAEVNCDLRYVLLGTENNLTDFLHSKRS